jgi:hypothetical protein
MVFRPLLTQNSIKFDRNRWVNILETIAHKNNPLGSKGERPQIMFIEKTPQRHLKNTFFGDIFRKRANLIWWYVVFLLIFGPSIKLHQPFCSSFLFFLDFVQDTRVCRWKFHVLLLFSVSLHPKLSENVYLS